LIKESRVSASISNLTRYLLSALKPGAWAEFVEYDLTLCSPDSTIPADSVTQRNNDEFIKATREANMEPNPGPLLENWVRDARYLGILHVKNPLPIGTWPADKRLVRKAPDPRPEK
jgi:hypothetical protein